MSTQTISLSFDHRESLRGTLLLSVGLHIALFVTAIVYTLVGPRFGGGWGKGWGGGDATRVGVVSSLPGVPLPTPMVTTRSTVATQNPGLHKSEPQPKLPPIQQAQEIPKFKEALKPETAQRINKRIQKEEVQPRENAIPFGLGGPPTMNYTQVVNQAGSGGLNFGEGGGFGQRYGWYVASVRSRISNNWLLSTISPNIITAPRIYVTFVILRDGTITDVHMTQSSGIPEVDRSALRAILASNPLPALPNDYGGSKVNVEFFFDFHRQ